MESVCVPDDFSHMQLASSNIEPQSQIDPTTIEADTSIIDTEQNKRSFSLNVKPVESISISEGNYLTSFIENKNHFKPSRLFPPVRRTVVNILHSSSDYMNLQEKYYFVQSLLL